MGDRDQRFEFRVELFDGKPGAGGSSLPGGGTVFMKHGQFRTLGNIPIGAWVRVTEESAENYETVYQAGELSVSGRSFLIGPVTAPAEILCTNTREMLIDTGITLDSVPYLWMTAVGTLVLRRRRRG